MQQLEIHTLHIFTWDTFNILCTKMLSASEPFCGIRPREESAQNKYDEETDGKSGNRCTLPKTLHSSSKI